MGGFKSLPQGQRGRKNNEKRGIQGTQGVLLEGEGVLSGELILKCKMAVKKDSAKG